MDVGKVPFEVLVGELEVGQEVGDDFWLAMRRRWGSEATTDLSRCHIQRRC